MDEIYVTLQMSVNSPNNEASETFKYNASAMRFEPFDTFLNDIPQDAVQGRFHTNGNGEYFPIADVNSSDLETIAGVTGMDTESFKNMHFMDMETQVVMNDNANKVHEAIYDRSEAAGIVPQDEIEKTVDLGNGRSQTTITPIYSPEDQLRLNQIASEEVAKFGHGSLPRDFMESYPPSVQAPAQQQTDLGVQQDTMNVLDSIKQQFDTTLDSLNNEVGKPAEQQPAQQAPAKSGGRGY